MNDIDIMEQNLARLLSQHLSQPSLDTTEPTDPFQKRTFGKKLRKSAVSLIQDHRTNSLPKQKELHYREEAQQDEETEAYMREVEVVLARLRVGLERVEEGCRERLQKICATNNGKQRQQKAEAALGELEASVDFILNDCFTSHPNGKENRHDKDNRESRAEKETFKKNIGGSKPKQTAERQGRERHEKSIYQSVLEERKMRRSKKRMI